ncbi:MAG: amphi-Trp domain-containing protein [Deltaproteobacteria bacterium]|jgi:amphi-Trp domain-containing protein|nr:amphi-Trp domain-containing protein [Deltaproteobacteria bacterium]
MSKNSLTHKFVSDPDEVAGFFQALIEGFKKRKLTISSDHKDQVMIPAEVLEMALETAHRKGRVRLSLSISWTEVDAYPKRDLFSDLRPKKPESDES